MTYNICYEVLHANLFCISLRVLCRVVGHTQRDVVHRAPVSMRVYLVIRFLDVPVVGRVQSGAFIDLGFNNFNLGM